MDSPVDQLNNDLTESKWEFNRFLRNWVAVWLLFSVFMVLLLLSGYVYGNWSEQLFSSEAAGVLFLVGVLHAPTVFLFVVLSQCVSQDDDIVSFWHFLQMFSSFSLIAYSLSQSFQSMSRQGLASSVFEVIVNVLAISALCLLLFVPVFFDHAERCDWWRTLRFLKREGVRLVVASPFLPPLMGYLFAAITWFHFALSGFFGKEYHDVIGVAICLGVIIPFAGQQFGELELKRRWQKVTRLEKELERLEEAEDD